MKSNALLKTLGFLALAATPVVAGTAPAPKNPIAPAPTNDDLGITASMGYDTSYVWRGLNYGNNWVRAGINGSLLLVGGAAEDGAGSTSLTYGVQYGSLAGDSDSFTPSLKGTPFSSRSSYQRLQAAVGLEHDFGAFALNFGYTYISQMGGLANGNPLGGLFGFNNGTFGMNDIHQLGLGLTTSLGPVNLASSANWDMANGGYYFDLNLNTKIAVNDMLSVVPFAQIGYGINYNYGIRKGSLALFNADNQLPGVSSRGVNGFTALTVGINFPIKLSSRATLTPYIAYNAPMAGLRHFAHSSRTTNIGGFPPIYLPGTAFSDVLYGGVTLSVKF